MATTSTAKLQLQKPADSDKPWGTAYRTSMDNLEDRLTKSHAGDPNDNVASEFLGQYCIDTSGSVLYQSTQIGTTSEAVWTPVTVKDGAITASKLAVGAAIPPGTVMAYGGVSQPAGYLFPHGQEVARATYADLFLALGTTYGASTSLVFALPDIRGRVIAGKDNMGGTSANRLTGTVSGTLNGDNLGATGGAETHTMTQAELVTHSHSGTAQSDGSHAHSYTAPTNGTAAGQQSGVAGATTAGTTGAAGAHTHTLSIANAGSSNPFAIMQPTIILNYIIKT